MTGLNLVPSAARVKAFMVHFSLNVLATPQSPEEEGQHHPGTVKQLLKKKNA